MQYLAQCTLHVHQHDQQANHLQKEFYIIPKISQSVFFVVLGKQGEKFCQSFAPIHYIFFGEKKVIRKVANQNLP